MELSTKKKNSPYALTATIALDAVELQQYIERAKREIAKEVTIEGFRKGKAPQHVVDQQLNADAVRSEALEYALEGSFSEAVEQQHWDVMKTSELHVDQNDAKGLRYHVDVFLWPVVTLPDLATVCVSPKPIEVSEAEIDEALDSIRNMRASFIDKTGAAAEGDRVEIDFDVTLNGTPVEGGSSRNHPLVIGGKNFMPGFEEELIGMTPDQVKQFSLVAPADYYEQKLAGKKLDFSVTMHKVQAVLKPAADDAFAQSLGKFTDLAALRANLREGITSEKRSKEQQRVRLATLDAIIAQTKVPAPEELVNEELGEMIHRFGHDLQHRGIELSMYLARMKKTEDDLRRDWKPEAERQVRISLILRAVTREHHIHVSSEELDAALASTMNELVSRGGSPEQLDPQRIRSALLERMVTDRALEFLEKSCVKA